ncbi:50S ribosomal protein L11 methyltransferase [Xanthobacter tagetidis]|uniref:Ribosomal protein L11 methyltransferase n=1 Tax=Xanthobacter tagetidis TaxID=60216 RepID=A0A3L7A8B5_9HYPH|nr:50S ribosomal protein L11 methyltransferase [Xanthobacter tagetidis]MBB6309332.1 ribosomal protein L11 methyltransferase [Xanthobacter tagetidis]RLP76646.1 50S ribosomal protein L11 methyltransferase [Xanthobacter tagetidis]
MLEGLPPNDATHVMRVSAPREKARRIADLISETYDPAEVAVANFEAPDGEWVVEVFAGAAFDPDDLKALVACAAGEALADAVSFSQIAETDWVAASLEGLAPVRVGPFMVHGAHDRARVKGATIGIEIEAALAFGTGHHGTTQGCLAAVADAARRGRPRRILDIGTGTGVLAIAAARALRTRVTASDIDIVAVRTARENACANGAAPFVRFVHAAGADARAVGQDGPYDLILANILLPPLKRLARPLCALLAPGGTVVLSGLLDAQASAALSAYRARGLHLVRRRSIEGWTTLTLAREAGRPLLRR